MRLTDCEVKTIKESIRALDKNSNVYLFGSRSDDTKRGGDIDLLIISKKLGYDDSIRIRQKLYENLGEQKIHIIISKDILDPFVKIAYSQGIKL